MLGKRPRPPMSRTMSMTAIRVDIGDVELPSPLAPQSTIISDVKKVDGLDEHIMEGPSGYYNRSMAILSPRCHMSGSGDSSMETAHFLRTCGLCKRRLALGRDIYMYMGDTAFCSVECREQQMKQDERKEKLRVAASKKLSESHYNHSSPPTAAPEASSNSETVAAA
ncbi:unnamed protein product [Ilex paraguariensis]|uniref:FLZ-type domain-containing protein n=1 Tax=Ilex paraguariensis TaxID=185542 RepID=A0ABC8TJ20_9AQUA